MSIPEVLQRISDYPTRHVLLTGGEPLLQRGTRALLGELRGLGYHVSIETHGEASIREFSGLARIIMDIKTPGSGMCRMGFMENLPHLRRGDEVKFVITSSEDYRWAADFVRSNPLEGIEYIFSPAVPAEGSPGTFPGVRPRDLADWILRDRLLVRFQIQLHKHLWGPDTKGV